MAFTKHGTGRVLKDEDQAQPKHDLVASDWTEQDQDEFERENAQADSKDQA